jgi:hypothetical protein
MGLIVLIMRCAKSMKTPAGWNPQQTQDMQTKTNAETHKAGLDVRTMKGTFEHRAIQILNVLDKQSALMATRIETRFEFVVASENDQFLIIFADKIDTLFQCRDVCWGETHFVSLVVTAIKERCRIMAVSRAAAGSLTVRAGTWAADVTCRVEECP